MNYEQVVAQNNEKIESSAFYAVANQFLAFVEVYPPVMITAVKDDKKMVVLCKQADKVYANQTAFSPVVNDIKSSLILAGNDVVVPHYISEMAMFAVRLHRLTDSILALGSETDRDIYALNQHLINYFKQIKLKQKDIQSAMVGDLKMMGDQFGFEVDVKASVTMYQEVIAKHYAK
ncbi:hypothetical protein LMH73_002535 [Vibrio splendidus]|nr:hypothetical protein [Vibrio splendidus]MCC4880460.1 hypothetical protein [Vibrio splendidus]